MHLIRSTRVTVDDAKKLLKETDQQAVIVLSVARNGEVRMTSIGYDEDSSRIITDWAKQIFGDPRLITKVPWQTAFGWGNGGVPKPLTAEELIKLTVSERLLVAKNTR